MVREMLKLYPRENDVAQLLMRGMSSKQIAKELNISYYTARSYRERLYRKLGVRKITQLIRILLQEPKILVDRYGRSDTGGINLHFSTVSQLKGSGGPPTHPIPCEGTHRREIYDKLQQNRGCPVQFSGRSLHSVMRSLRDEYGLDIRCTRKGNQHNQPSYILVGEWFGERYEDYVAARMDAPNAPVAQLAEAAGPKSVQ